MDCNILRYCTVVGKIATCHARPNKLNYELSEEFNSFTENIYTVLCIQESSQ